MKSTKRVTQSQAPLFLILFLHLTCTLIVHTLLFHSFLSFAWQHQWYFQPKTKKGGEKSFTQHDLYENYFAKKNGMYCAQVIFKSVVGGWLWVRVRKYFAHFMGGLESFCTLWGGLESFCTTWEGARIFLHSFGGARIFLHSSTIPSQV